MTFASSTVSIRNTGSGASTGALTGPRPPKRKGQPFRICSMLSVTSSIGAMPSSERSVPLQW